MSELNNELSLEEEIEKVWTDSELRGVATRYRRGWRDCLIATGPSPTMAFSSKYKKEKDERLNRPIMNAIKYNCSRQIHGIIEKNLLMAQLSPNTYVREFAEQMIKNKKGK